MKLTAQNSYSWRLIAWLLIAALAAPAQTPSPQKPRAPGGKPLYRFKAISELVLINAIVRDKSRQLMRGLTQDDFTLLEDGKPQSISSFDIEQADVTALPELPQASILAATPAPAPGAPPPPAQPEHFDFRNRRLLVLFFDLSSMQPEEIDRAAEAAQRFVSTQMTAADLVAVVSLAASLAVNQDFTADRTILAKTLARFSSTAGEGFEAGATGDTEGTPDTGQAFTADDTEFNIFNTDRRLEALQSVAESLARIEQKKSIIYLSSGMGRTGVENQSELRNAVNRAIRSNVTLYTMDMRGLQAIVPGGEAQQASLRGTAPYSGRAVQNAFDSNFATQETLSTLAADTGGRAFLDSNDFNAVFRKVQEDTSFYYLLGYKSANPARDGRFRRVTVRVRLPNLKIEHRAGYYAPRDWAHSSREDREQQLVDELTSEMSSTDLNVFLSAAYFRAQQNRFYVPVSLVVPGSEIPFTKGGDKDRATLDVMGVVRDELGRPVGNIRDSVKLNLDETQEIRRKNVQYQTSFLLLAGTYHLKFVLRENESGRLGSFETDITLPDFKKTPLKMSSVVLAAQLRPSTRRTRDNPLVRDGQELIPNVTHVFSADQRLYFYYEVYEPAKETRVLPAAATANTDSKAAKAAIRLLTSIQFFQGKVKAYETPLVEARQISVPERRAAAFQLDVPLSQLRPGFYTCQVNVIDDAAGAFAFPRLALLVRK